MPPTNHNHVTRDIKKPGICPGCDEYHLKQCKVLEDPNCNCRMCQLAAITDACGGYVELEGEPAPATVKEWMELARASGHDSLGIANDPEWPNSHRLDGPDGPVCACGQPSTHESGWCGECKDASCRVNMFSSRACELGTRSCEVRHGE